MQMRSLVAVACLLAPLLGACEDAKPAAESKPAVASAPVAVPAPTPSASPPSAPAAAEKPERPAKIDTELTPARRSALETKYVSAKGFLVATEQDKKAAVAAFDKAARGKWLLFSGPLVNLTDAGFDLGIVYTPQLPNDPMGMSRQFFEVTLTQIEGYSKEAFRTGNVVVVLAKYNGAGKAGPGHELVASGDWK